MQYEFIEGLSDWWQYIQMSICAEFGVVDDFLTHGCLDSPALDDPDVS